MKRVTDKKSDDKKPVEIKPDKPKRKITLSDGNTVELDDITPRDKYYRSKTIRLKKQGTSLIPADVFKKPDFIPGKYDKVFNLKQQDYRKNTVTPEDLRKRSEKTIKSNNRQGMARYVFWSELKACKNGFIYYSLPFLIDIVFLFFNFFVYNFWANIIFSIVVLFDMLCIYKTYKSPYGFFIKIMLLILLIAGNVGLYYLGKYVPGLYEEINMLYSVKLLLILFCFYHFGKFYAVFLRVYYDDLRLEQTKRCVQVYSGDPGSYKSFSMYHDASILAKMQWRKLCYEYYLWHSREDEILKRNDKDELLEYNEIKRSFSFYYLSPCIPCLHTINGVKDRDGRYSHKVTINHLRGLDPLPKYCVVVLDEVGAFLKQEYGMMNSAKKDSMLDVSDCFRLGRQYYNWILLCAEQDFNHIYIDVRRVVGFNKVMKGGQPLCKPWLLSGIYNLIYSIVTDLLDSKIHTNKHFTKFMEKFNKIIRSIGFVKVYSSFANNTETDVRSTVSDTSDNNIPQGHAGFRYMPIQGVNIYDTYAYKKMNPSYYDKSISCDIHTRLDLDGTDFENRKFLNTTSLLDEKRDATDNDIKKLR